ncbi:MAG: hypothetical protein AVDCRST_MAG93-7650 [uncultured Chloroflexia bacterium]|uniref:Uncharacterized protein n=1 Tax=uncultured Chloroflexia bacterium TaxID=1672391 RepID=A0A6J4MKX1_9CHLR|nr:MAG: hypothetical protein AVDCRST_MAG93-7650 [uncultured Chloroflexia bacterium]
MSVSIKTNTSTRLIYGDFFVRDVMSGRKGDAQRARLLILESERFHLF